jgi:hypothetical protein
METLRNLSFASECSIIFWIGKGIRICKRRRSEIVGEILTLIHKEVESNSLLSAWISTHSASMFIAAITNLPIWSLALMKSGSLARDSMTCGID